MVFHPILIPTSSRRLQCHPPQTIALCDDTEHPTSPCFGCLDSTYSCDRKSSLRICELRNSDDETMGERHHTTAFSPRTNQNDTRYRAALIIPDCRLIHVNAATRLCHYAVQLHCGCGRVAAVVWLQFGYDRSRS